MIAERRREKTNVIVGILKPMAATELGEEAWEVFSILNDWIYPVCMILNMNFCDMVKEHETNLWESL